MKCHTRSIRGNLAIKYGRLNTKALKIELKKLGWDLPTIFIQRSLPKDEWHHKFYGKQVNKENFYVLEDVINWLEYKEIPKNI